VGLDQAHGGVDGGAEVLAFGDVDESGEAGLVGNEQDRSRPVVVGGDGPADSGPGCDLGPDLLEAVLGVGQEDETEDRAPVLVGGERRVGPQFIGRRPQRAAYLGKVCAVHDSSSSAQ